MFTTASLDLCNAQSGNSIWRDVPEDIFRRHLVELEERTNAVPTESETFSAEAWQSTRGSFANEHVLTLAVERQLADDFALLAAVEEGAQSVAAACIEERSDGQGMVVRFAAMDAVKLKHQDALRGIARAMMDSAENRLNKRDVLERPNLRDLRGRIIRLHRNRIVARLRSVKWPKPRYLAESHKKPLWKDFSNLLHRAQFMYSKREQKRRVAIQLRLQKLACLYEGFEETEIDATLEQNYLSQIIEESYKLCTCDDMKAYVQKLEAVRATAQVASAIKCVRQVEKIAALWRIPVSLLRAVERYPSLSININLQYLTPYGSIPTTISYESWAKTCHVHAEVQLAVYYDLHQPEQRLRPRVIGTSKYMCFLCLHFVKAHGQFFPANTHGRLYDQWTIPEVAEFSDAQIQNYRTIIKEIDDRVLELTVLEPKWRPEPMTSRQDLSQLAGAVPAWTGATRSKE
jgi:hypothetical protein